MKHFSYNYKAPAEVVESLKKVCEVLRDEAVDCEKAAFAVKNRGLKEGVLYFVQESQQYASELKSQIECLGGNAGNHLHFAGSTSSVSNLEKNEAELFDLISKSEERILSAYRRILNNSEILNGLRQLIRNQFNGMLCAFQQFKILNAACIGHRI